MAAPAALGLTDRSSTAARVKTLVAVEGKKLLDAAVALRGDDLGKVERMVAGRGGAEKAAFEHGAASGHDLRADRLRVLQRDAEFLRLIRDAARAAAAAESAVLQRGADKPEREFAGLLDQRAAQPFFAETDAEHRRMIAQKAPPGDGHQIGFPVLPLCGKQSEGGGRGELLRLADGQLVHIAPFRRERVTLRLNKFFL